MSETMTDPRWGDQRREEKALSILATLGSVLDVEQIRTSSCVDLGCGSGEIAFHLAGHMRDVTGVDPEPWQRWDEFLALRSNLNYLHENAEALSIPPDSVDIVICNQVYEHVRSPQNLIREIYRILKPGGYCYFAGPNLLFPIEPHVFWPFVHWLPRRFAVGLMRLCGSKGTLDAYSTHLWQLHRWFNELSACNRLPYILHNPDLYGRSGWFWRLFKLIPKWLIDRLTWISPAFVFVLRKPE